MLSIKKEMKSKCFCGLHQGYSIAIVTYVIQVLLTQSDHS